MVTYRHRSAIVFGVGPSGPTNRVDCHQPLRRLLMWLTLLWGTTCLADINVSLSVSPKSGSMDDTFLLSVIVEGSQDTEYPELVGGDDFDAVLLGPETRMQVVNGAFSSQIAYRYNLTAKKAGELTSPSARIKVEGKVYEPPATTVKVSESQSSTDPAGQDVILQQIVSQVSAYRGEQIISTLDLMSRFDLRELNFQSSTFDGFTSTQLGDVQRDMKRIGGEVYRVFQRRLALFPTRSGKIDIPPQRALATVWDTSRNARKRGSPLDEIFGSDPFNDPLFGGFFGGQLRSLKLSSNALTVTVKDLPPLPPDAQLWGASQPIVGETSLQIDYPTQIIKVGEALTVTVTVKSFGNLNALDRADLKAPASVKIFGESPTTQQAEVSGKLETTKSFKLSLIPERAGVVYIPAPQLSYFDPQERLYRTATTSPISITAEGLTDQETGAIEAPVEPSSKPTTIATPEPAPAQRYEEPTSLEKLSRQVSAPFVALVITLLLLVAGSVLLAVRAVSSRRPLKRLITQLAQAQNAESLERCLREILMLQYQLPIHLSNQQLKAELLRRISDHEQLFVLQNALDQLEAARFGGASIEVSMLAAQLTGVVSTLNR